MIFYNWNKVYLYSKGSVRDILYIMYTVIFKKCPYDKNYPTGRFYPEQFLGTSYLLNPKPLFIHRRSYKDVDLARYFGFAALRSYADYKLYGTTELDLSLISDKEKLIKENALLRVVDNTVIFKFEEELKGEDSLWH